MTEARIFEDYLSWIKYFYNLNASLDKHKTESIVHISLDV